MSLDISADDLCSYCPHCGGALMITVRQVMDILNDKKEIMQKGVKYATKLSDVQIREKEKTRKKKIDIVRVLIAVSMALVIFFLRWKKLL
jgi:hypothetical protein